MYFFSLENQAKKKKRRPPEEERRPRKTTMPCVKESFVVSPSGSRVHEGLILTSSTQRNPTEGQQ